MKKNKNSRLHSYIDLLRSFKTKTIQTRFAQTVIVLERLFNLWILNIKSEACKKSAFSKSNWCYKDVKKLNKKSRYHNEFIAITAF